MKELGALADHLGQRELDLPTSRRELYKAILKRLLRASDERQLTSGPDSIRRAIKVIDIPPALRDDLARQGLADKAFDITGGDKNQNRDKALGHIERNDGAWFDFSIVAREVKKSARDFRAIHSRAPR